MAHEELILKELGEIKGTVTAIHETQERLIKGLDLIEIRVTQNEKSISWIWGACRGLGMISAFIGIIWGVSRLLG